MDQSPLPAPRQSDGPDLGRTAAGPLSEPPRTPVAKPPGGWRSPIFQVYLSAAFVTASELALKLGADQIAGSAHRFAWFFSPWVWAGIVAGLVSMAGWLAAIRHMALSVAFIHTNIVHVTVPICAWLVLGERLSVQRWLGIACVLAGIACIAQPLAQIEESR